MAKVDPAESVVVIGLGRFGGAVAEALLQLDREVLGIDNDVEVVQQWSDKLTHVVEADATDSNALSDIGVRGVRSAVVGIGSDIESSVLTVLALDELGVDTIWAKVVSPSHGKILKRIGADHVVFPELEMGERVAHLVTGEMMDFVEFEAAFAIAKTAAPERFCDKRIADCKLREEHGITVIGIKKSEHDFVYAEPDTLIEKGDLLVIAGPTPHVESFASLS